MTLGTKGFTAAALALGLAIGIFIGIPIGRGSQTTVQPLPVVDNSMDISAAPDVYTPEPEPDTETDVLLEEPDPSEEQLEGFDYSRIFTLDGKLIDIDVSNYITLPDYSAIYGDGNTMAMLDEMLKQEIAYLLLNFEKEERITDRAVELHDMVDIAYIGRIDDVRFEGGSTESAIVLAGSSEYVDDFLEQIIGHMPGETFDVTVTFPEDYASQELAGREAVFETTINFIYGAGNFTDDFVHEFLETDYGFTTTKDVIDYLSENYLITYKRNLVAQFFEELIEAHTENMEIPQNLYDYFADSYLKYYEDAAAMYGMDLLSALQTFTGAASIEDAVMAQHDSFIYDAVFIMAVQAIAEAEGITVDTEDMETSFADMGWDAEYYQENIEMYGAPYFANYLLMDKVGELLVERVVFPTSETTP